MENVEFQTSAQVKDIDEREVIKDIKNNNETVIELISTTVDKIENIDNIDKGIDKISNKIEELSNQNDMQILRSDIEDIKNKIDTSKDTQPNQEILSTIAKSVNELREEIFSIKQNTEEISEQVKVIQNAEEKDTGITKLSKS